MDYLFEYITKVIPINLLELLAAIAGTYYLKNNTNTLLVNKYLVYFLWYTFINELIASYAPIAYFTDYEHFSFVKNTIFSDNVWLYNIYSIISFSLFVYYFSYFSSEKKIKRINYFAILIYIIACVLYLLNSGVFFISVSLFTSIIGTFLLLYSIIRYYLDLLKSDTILDLKKHLPVYISGGVLVFYLSVTPLDIFTHYFNSDNDIFVSLRTNILLFTNIFMYSTFILGFIICTKKKAT